MCYVPGVGIVDSYGATVSMAHNSRIRSLIATTPSVFDVHLCSVCRSSAVHTSRERTEHRKIARFSVTECHVDTRYDATILYARTNIICPRQVNQSRHHSLDTNPTDREHDTTSHTMDAPTPTQLASTAFTIGLVHRQCQRGYNNELFAIATCVCVCGQARGWGLG